MKISTKRIGAFSKFKMFANLQFFNQNPSKKFTLCWKMVYRLTSFCMKNVVVNCFASNSVTEYFSRTLSDHSSKKDGPWLRDTQRMTFWTCTKKSSAQLAAYTRSDQSNKQKKGNDFSSALEFYNKLLSSIGSWLAYHYRM